MSIPKIFRLWEWPLLLRYPTYLFIAMVVVYFIMDIIVMPLYTRHGQAIKVPNVAEMTYEGARTLLSQQGLTIVEKAKKFDINYRSGVVISQHPNAGSEVKKGRRIYVLVSKGEPTVEMPQLIGKSEKNAEFEATRLGIEIRHITAEHSSHYPDGVIINQSVPFGEEIKIGGSVDLIVSLGQFPDKFIVPALLGRSLKDAKRVIQKSGLKIGMVTYRIKEDLLPETVIEQSIEANTEVNMGETLHLVVSKLPEENEIQ